MILLIIGPSGSGKSSVVSALSGSGLLQPHPTWTDRAPRPGELDGIEHRFTTAERFNELTESGYFIGTTERFSHHYGLARWPDQRTGVLTVVLRADLVDLFAAAAAPEPVLVYQITASRQQVIERLQERDLPDDEFRSRLDEHDSELALGTSIADRTFVNDTDLATTIATVKAAVEADFQVDEKQVA